MTATDYQLDFNGTIMGDGTAWDIVSWAGLEMFATHGSDVVLPTGWGAIPGSSYVDPRVVTIVVESVDPTNMLLLEAALLPPANVSPADLVPIRWKFPNREELRVFGRCSRRVRNRDLTTALGLTRLTFELEIPDPRAYAASALSGSLSVFVSGSSGFDLTVGAGVDIGFDLTVGAGVDIGFDLVGISGSGLLIAMNAGQVDTYPQMVFSAPTGLSSWSVTNQTTGQVFTVNQTVNVGETLIADMQAAATGSTSLPISLSGVSRYGSWQAPRIPLRLIPGANLLRFDVATGDPNAACLITWASAYL